MKYVRPQRISLKTHSELNEKWVQERIAEDPTILGLGDLILKDKERLQPQAGRLDLLLQNLDTDRRFEVEVQLGKTDPSHIIRTVEYWDIECKRYPQYDHCAVIVAEEITSRFLNVISLFNRSIPLIAIQMQALCVEDKIMLVFTTVLDERHLGPEAENEVIVSAVDRPWWEKRRSQEVMGITDRLLDLLNQFDPGWKLRYNRGNVHIESDREIGRFLRLRPRKQDVLLIFRVDESNEFSALVEESGLDTLSYLHAYRLIIRDHDLKERAEVIQGLMRRACETEKSEISGSLDPTP
jgi:hypothetical protein